MIRSLAAGAHERFAKAVSVAFQLWRRLLMLQLQCMALWGCAEDAYVFHPGISAVDYNIEDGCTLLLV